MDMGNKTRNKRAGALPHQAIWSRFRLEGDSRLIGFVLPDEYKDSEQNKSGFRFDTNTFYVVFLASFIASKSS